MGCQSQQAVCVLIVVFFVTFGVGGFMIVMGGGSGLSIVGGVLLAIGFIGFGASGCAMVCVRRPGGFAGYNNRQVIVTGQPAPQGIMVTGQAPNPGMQYPTDVAQPPGPYNQYGVGTANYGPSYPGTQQPMQYGTASSGVPTYIPPGGTQPAFNTYGGDPQGQLQYGAPLTDPSAPPPPANDTAAPPPSYNEVVDPNYGIKQ